MKTTCTWDEKLRFTAKVGQHSYAMDTKPPLGSDTGPSPKELVLGAICGCTAMDVISLLRKHKQDTKSFQILAEAAQTEGEQPRILKDIHLVYEVEGEVVPEVLVEAVNLSMTKYCGVSAMIVKSCPITYSIQLNGNEVAQGKADFK